MDDCNAWIQENYPGHKQEDNMPTPDFHLTTVEAKWGDGEGHVEATVLKFWCAEKNGLYLKSLMSHACASTKLKGQFIPTKAWLLTSRDAYRNLLQLHNTYMEEITVITIEGIHPTVANKYIAVAEQTMAIKAYIVQKTELIESMECTSNSEEKGKWFFIAKKSNAAAASNLLNIELKKLYQRVVSNNIKFDIVPIPRRAKSRAAKA
eukprot:10276497-Ditylum_brightwellii.AAC.1